MTEPTLDELRTGFAAPPADAAPMIRWWWFGPRVKRDELARQLRTIRDGGFGGVELSVVYPITEETDRYLSASFLADVRFAAEEARGLGLRFDLTLGSGWSYGGPHITPELAARRLHWDRREIGTAPASIPVPQGWPGDEFIGAYLGDGSIQEPPTRFEPLEVAGGRIRVPEGRGPRLVLLATSRLTGQQVKRAAAGAEGPVLDHYSLEATVAHLDAVAAPLLDAVPGELLGSVFCDSLEAYAADWTPGIVDEFRLRHGYDPVPELYLLEVDGERSPGFRADFYRVLTELYEERFVAPIRRWAAERGVPFRLQGYGEPPAALSSYRFADQFEGEGWGWAEIPQTRWASSAAHHYGRRVVSSETWTWIHSPSFRATPMDLRGEAHEHLLVGINHFIGHGWPYADADAGELGQVFYAAGAFDDRNPWWPAMRPLTGYLHRLAWLMRQGDPVADVGVYVPDDELYAAMHSDGEGVLNLWKRTRAHIGDAVPRVLRESGYDFDLVDDAALIAERRDFAVIVLPYVTALPRLAAERLAAFRRAGGLLVSVGPAPAGTDAVETTAEGLATALAAHLAPDVALDPPAPTLGAVHRRAGDHELYFVANTGPDAVRGRLTFRTPAATVECWDAETGAVSRASVSGGTIELELAPYEAAVFVTSREPAATDAGTHGPGSGAAAAAPAPGGDAPASVRALEEWTVRFADGSAPYGIRTPHRWEDEPGRAAYSGAALYATTVQLHEGDAAGRAVLDFGDPTPVDAGADAEAGIRGRSYRVRVVPPVGEIAEVRVNGRPAGTVWATPYRLEIGGLLRPGENRIELRVANTAGNAFAADPSVQATADASAERYGRRFRMQDLDLADAGVASGLLATPHLRIGPRR